MRHRIVPPPMTRREALSHLGGGFGMFAFASMLGHGLAGATRGLGGNPMAAKAPHFPASAKRVIFLFLTGGMSQVDTFDPKPMLDKYDGKPLPYETPLTENATGNLMPSPFSFKKYGQSGIEVAEIFPKLAGIIDDFCVIRSMHTDIPNHGPSMMMMNSGLSRQGRPALGSWITYGLGTENQNLPGFVVFCAGGAPRSQTTLWNSAFLPAAYQGTFISNKESEAGKQIQYLRNGKLSMAEQREQLDLLGKLSRLHQQQRQQPAPEMEAAIQSMEIAYRMQTEAPDVFDLSGESQATLERYGEGDFARGCLMARRLIERGVRVVQVYFGGRLGQATDWDSHTDIMAHRTLAQMSDGAMTTLIQDLKERGLLDETLVLIGSEFGRTPVLETGGISLQNGRDHNSHGFTCLLAGGGVKAGMVYGATDDFGFKAEQNPVHVHDLHATMLHLLGFDHERLTYRYSGRDFRLTDVHGHVVKDILA